MTMNVLPLIVGTRIHKWTLSVLKPRGPRTEVQGAAL